MEEVRERGKAEILDAQALWAQVGYVLGNTPGLVRTYAASRGSEVSRSFRRPLSLAVGALTLSLPRPSLRKKGWATSF